MGEKNLQVIEAHLPPTLLLCSTAALINLSHTLHNTTMSCKLHTALHTIHCTQYTAHCTLLCTALNSLHCTALSTLNQTNLHYPALRLSLQYTLNAVLYNAVWCLEQKVLFGSALFYLKYCAVHCMAKCTVWQNALFRRMQC